MGKESDNITKGRLYAVLEPAVDNENLHIQRFVVKPINFYYKEFAVFTAVNNRGLIRFLQDGWKEGDMIEIHWRHDDYESKGKWYERKRANLIKKPE
jgi:hypothetical protein